MTVQIVTEVFPIFGQPTYYGEVTEDLEVIIYDGPITFDTDGNADDFNIVVATGTEVSVLKVSDFQRCYLNFQITKISSMSDSPQKMWSFSFRLN